MGTGAAFSFSTADSKLVRVENISMGAGASVTLTGQNEAFTITGGGGAETIISGAGDDTINGGLGNDFIQGAAGADVINGGAGRDTASYADVTGATSHGLTDITGIAVNLTGDAIDQADVVAATASTDDLGFSDKNLQLNAGTAQYMVADTKASADHSVDTLNSVEGIIGSALNDYIFIGVDSVTVDTGAGVDVVFSGTADDNISTGTGNDIIVVEAGANHGTGEVINGGTGADVIRFTSVLRETLTLSSGVTGVETVEISDVAGKNDGTTGESIDASNLTYGIALVGNDGDNTLTGSAFADTFVAGKGDDRLLVDDLDTAVDGGDDNDTIVLVSDVTFGILAADGLTQQLENVEAAELASGVTLTVDLSDVAVKGTLQTFTGVADGATETLVVIGNPLGSKAAIDFSGVAMDLTDVVLEYRGGAGIDKVTGSDNADIISGGFGDDVLTVKAGGGADTLSGGDGNDNFDVSAADSATDIVVITDYEVFGAAKVDTLTVVGGANDGVLAGVVTKDTRTDFAFDGITRTDGLTIESFEVTDAGLVTLYDSDIGVGTIDEVFAETAADIYALIEQLTLLSGGATDYTFEYDFNGDGTADGQIVVSDDALGVVNIVQLVGVTGAELDASIGNIVLA